MQRKYPLAYFVNRLDEVVQNHIDAEDFDSKNLTQAEIEQVVAETLDYFTSFLCMDCGLDTFHYEYYMVHDHVWEEAVKEYERQGMLCIGCLETRLHRSLNAEDFPEVAINVISPTGANQSTRMVSRLTNAA